MVRKVVRLENLTVEIRELEDLRESRKVLYKMGDVMALSLFATLARCDDLKEVYLDVTFREDNCQVVDKRAASILISFASAQWLF